MTRFRNVLLLTLGLAIASPAHAALRILLIHQTTALTSEETARKTTFEGWGYTVNTLQDSSSQPSYDAAFALNDVVYISEEANDGDVASKARLATIGVVNENIALDDDLGFATSAGTTGSHTNINIINTTHPIMLGQTSGSQAIFGSNQPRTLASGTVASGMTALGTNSSSVLMHGCIETGGALANTVSSNSTALGRRVRMPMGGSTFVWSSLNSTGLTLTRYSIIWAAGQDSLLIHLKLNESSGTSMADASAYGRNATISGNYTLGVTGSHYLATTLNASGTNGLISLPNVTLTGQNNLSTSFWIKTTSSGIQSVFSAANGTTDNEFRIYFTSATSLQVYYHSSSATWSTTTTIGDGQWHHVAVVTNSAANSTTVYIDKVSQGAQVISPNGTALAVSSGGFIVGQEQDSVGGGYDSTQIVNGSIDEVRIYNKVLTAAEVAELYGLVGHYKLDETSGTTAADSSGVGNNGTVNGTATWVSGVRGNGFSADYTDGQDYIEIPNSTSLENVQEESYSLAGWFKPTNSPPGTGSDNNGAYRIIGKSGWHLGLNFENTGTFYMEHWLGTTPEWNGAGAWYYNAPGRWYHTVGVVDKDAGTIKFYLNGALVNTSSYTAGAAAFEYGMEPFRIGVSNPYHSTWGHAARGVLDDIRIYNRAIDEAEIVQIYGLIGRWKFDETSGIAAADSSGLGNNGTLTNGPTWTTSGVYDGGLTLDGTDDKVVVNNKQFFQLYEDFSCAGWVKLTNTTAAWRSVVGKGSNYYLETYGDQVYFGYYDGSAWKEISTSSGTLNVGKWYHLAGSFDNTANTLKIYVDGALKASAAATTTPASSSDKLQIGAAYDSASQFFPGTLDDVRLYNRALTDTEPAELYGLLGHWKLEESSGTTAADSSNNNYPATHANGVTVNSAGPYPLAGAVAAEYDGVNDVTTTNYKFTPPSTGTISFWMRGEGLPTTTTNRLFGINGDWEARMGTDGYVRFDIGSSSDDPNTGGSVATADQWNHIALVFDANTEAYSVYVNGVLKTSGTNSVGMVAQTADFLSIGTRTGSSEYYRGRLRDFRIYDRKLSAPEVLELYGVMHWFKFDETSGTTTADSGVYSNTATVNAGTASWVAGLSGNAFDFNGATSLVTGQNVIPPPQGAVSFWMKANTLNSAQQRLFGSLDNFEVRRDTTGTSNGVPYGLVFDLQRGPGATSFYTSSALNPNKWYYVAANFDDTTDTMQVYLDGYLQSAGTQSLAAQAGALLSLGTRTGTTDYFNGVLEEIRIYNRWLSAAEVLAQYKALKPPGIRLIKWVEVR